MKYKYPRTKHLPWSGSSTKDDKFLKDTDHFRDKGVVVTLKLDGGNYSLYPNGTFHARSLDSKVDESSSWLFDWWGNKLAADTALLMQTLELFQKLRVCGENLKGKHTIDYSDNSFFFYGHSIWVGEVCMDWRYTTSLLTNLDIPIVPVLYQGVYDEKRIREFDCLKTYEGNQVEGYVVRLSEAFKYDDFGQSVGKYVREDFKITGSHWKYGKVH